MKVEAVVAQQMFPVSLAPPGGGQAKDVQRAEAAVAEAKPAEKAAEPLVDSVALLDRIKDLTEDGAYSVRFEKSKDLNDIVVKLVDSESGDVIRQIPPEELLGLTKRLQELRAVIVNKQG